MSAADIRRDRFTRGSRRQVPRGGRRWMRAACHPRCLRGGMTAHALAPGNRHRDQPGPCVARSSDRACQSSTRLVGGRHVGCRLNRETPTLAGTAVSDAGRSGRFQGRAPGRTCSSLELAQPIILPNSLPPQPVTSSDRSSHGRGDHKGHPWQPGRLFVGGSPLHTQSPRSGIVARSALSGRGLKRRQRSRVQGSLPGTAWWSEEHAMGNVPPHSRVPRV